MDGLETIPLKIENLKAYAWIEITNKTEAAILFHVKATNPNYYSIRPSCEVIPSHKSIIFNLTS